MTCTFSVILCDLTIDGIITDDNIINQKTPDERRRGLPREYFVLPVPQTVEQCFLATVPQDVFRGSARNLAINK